MEEHRRSDRLSAVLSAELTDHLEGKSWELKARDVSTDGMFLAVKKPRRFRLGQTVTLRISVRGAPGEEPHVRVVVGEIVRLVERSAAKAHGGHQGIGVEFVEPQDFGVDGA